MEAAAMKVEYVSVTFGVEGGAVNAVPTNFDLPQCPPLS